MTLSIPPDPEALVDTHPDYEAPSRPPDQIPDQLFRWRAQVVQSLLIALSILGLIVLVAETILTLRIGRWDLVILIGIAYLALASVALLRRIPISIRAGVVVVVLYAMGVLGLSQSGLGGDGRMLMLVVPLLALILIGRKPGVVMFVICTLTLIVAALLMATGVWVPPAEPRSSETMPWITGVAVYLLLAVTMLLPTEYIIENLIASLNKTLQEIQAHLGESVDLSQRLEREVAERTAALARRSKQLEAAALVARRAAEVRQEEQLVEHIANLVAKQLDCDYAAIFLLDKTQNWLILRATSSETNRSLVQTGYRISVGDETAVGSAAAAGQPRATFGTQDVSSLTHLWPEAHTEIALPLRAHGTLIGVLDMQAIREDSLQEQDATTLQILADQLALSIENARLLTETQKSLDRLTRYQVEETLDSWRKALERRRKRLAYLYDQTTVRPTAPDESEMTVDLPRETIVHSLPDGRSILLAPIRVYDQAIGSLSFEAHRTWRPDEVALVDAAVQQLGLALENARLLEETRQRADRDRLIADITGKVRASTNVETILRTAVREIGAALGTDRTFVQLTSGAAQEKTA